MESLSEITYEIINEHEKGSLPNAILFWGERFSSKKTTAIELAKRILNTKTLTNPNLIIFSSLNIIEAKAYLNVNSKKVINKYLEYVKNIIFTKYNFSSDKNLKKIETDVNFINNTYYKNEYNETITKELIKKIEEIIKNINFNITISDVRKIKSWVLSEKHKIKVIYINEIENLNFNVYNALLKILEEPPLNIYFILATRNKNKIPKTILSRLRLYKFRKENRDFEIKKFKEIFNKNDELTTEEYFDSFYSEEHTKLKEEVKRILNIIKEKQGISNLDTFNFLKDENIFKLFLQELTNQLRHEFLSQNLDTNTYLKRLEYLKYISKYSPYNQNKKLIIENLMLNYED
ncbi:DNA polymerase III subunit gamma/tau [Borrelia parkeri]|uniref:DNA polymerase III subunit gamma/tau n=1 Tax=Borrelia parkeri TaxID=141 RepID=UPI0003D8A86D|nr:DNA polymerase III subunit gamma/tau [Borrelia parkeri]AHE63071.1 DNA polymerase III subunit gamma/tau [Borrelia parkeri HR1]